jgi:hypothetical protein
MCAMTAPAVITLRVSIMLTCGSVLQKKILRICSVRAGLQQVSEAVHTCHVSADTVKATPRHV